MSATLDEEFASLALEDCTPGASGSPGSAEPQARNSTTEVPPFVPQSDTDGATCAICLNKISLPDSAQPECCEHLYCACCILHWAVYKEKPWCPQCKAPFGTLLTFRALDGQLRDFPCRESVCLLKRTTWFQEHVKMREQAMAAAASGRPISAASAGFIEGSVIDESDYGDYASYYDEFDDDEEVENYYFSAAAGSARIVLGNRRHGPNGFISSGRIQARPAPAPTQSKGKKVKDATESGRQNGGRRQPGKSACAPHTPAQKGSGRGEGEDFDQDFSPGSSGGKQSAGRRARRNQKRAAADARAGF